jgi:hypothetical protein
MTGIQIRLTVVWLWSVSTCVAGEYVTYFNESDQELCVPLHSDMAVLPWLQVCLMLAPVELMRSDVQAAITVSN